MIFAITYNSVNGMDIFVREANNTEKYSEFFSNFRICENSMGFWFDDEDDEQYIKMVEIMKECFEFDFDLEEDLHMIRIA